jgi:hypothetical protein
MVWSRHFDKPIANCEKKYSIFNSLIKANLKNPQSNFQHLFYHVSH